MGRKMSKRLESAPAEELDKWVVELERIIDKRLEGLAKQGCWTYIVTRVSVAFDDLNWNAKAADKLFLPEAESSGTTAALGGSRQEPPNLLVLTRAEA
jgi:hypothetical protein